ncbi:hypothetical protein BDV97DRAFT_39242 [Delphinella strobiligena]|nr:hypothetical protein BDV97DRAFT_39242 [Delphinella strobiligena]
MTAIPPPGTELQLTASMASPRASDSSKIVTGQSTPPILTLPPEMIEKIGEAADPHDLLATRLSCTEICGALSKPFVGAHFMIRKHIVTTHSLSALIDITAHPIFGPAIRELWIDTTYPNDDLLGYLKRQYRHLDVGMYNNLSETYIRITDDHSTLDEGRGAELLAEVLTNLRKLSVVVSLGVFQDYKPWTRGWGYQQAYGMFPSDIICTQRTTYRLDLLFVAVRLSQYPIRVLLMDPVGVDDWSELDSFRHVESQITEFHIRSERPVELCSGDPLIGRLLIIMSKLTNFHVEVSPSSSDVLFGEIHDIRMQHLEDFCLSGLKVEGDELVQFLANHSSTLHTLTLGNLELTESENWDVVFLDIFEVLSLQRLEVYDLRANCAFSNGEESEGDHAESPLSVCVLRRPCSFVGAEQVREGLKDLIKHFVPTNFRVTRRHFTTTKLQAQGSLTLVLIHGYVA